MTEQAMNLVTGHDLFRLNVPVVCRPDWNSPTCLFSLQCVGWRSNHILHAKHYRLALKHRSVVRFMHLIAP
jgi:hypothetical protein